MRERSISGQSLLRRTPAGAGRGRIAPLSGTTLLVLVTLVLSAGHRDTLPVRQALGDARWAEPVSTRQTEEVAARPHAPTKPLAVHLVGLGPAKVGGDMPSGPGVWLGAPGYFGPAPAAALVRLGLLNLPPPRG